MAELEAGDDLRPVHQLADPPLDGPQRHPELPADRLVGEAGEQQGEDAGVDVVDAVGVQLR